jgi:hypothetical protein
MNGQLYINDDEEEEDLDVLVCLGAIIQWILAYSPALYY